MHTPFQLTDVTAMFVRMRVREELKEDNQLPDIDLFFSVRTTNDVLVMLKPDLRSMLFTEENKVRFPELGRHRFKHEIEGAITTIRYGVGRSNGRTKDIECDKTIVDRFVLQPFDGGSVDLGFRVRCKPSGEENGRLTLMLGREVTISVEEQQRKLDLNK